jgi:hypothetical protein
MFIPDPDLDFLPIPDHGVKKASDPQSGSATLIKLFEQETVRRWDPSPLPPPSGPYPPSRVDSWATTEYKTFGLTLRIPTY